MDGWLVHTRHRIFQSQGDDLLFPACLPACPPACMHASIYKEEELIIRLIIVHTTRIIMHQHLKIDDAGIFDCSGGGARRSKL